MSAVAGLLGGSGRRAELCLSDEVDRPSVVGFFRPRILLTPELFACLSAAELEQVVLHEMEHVRRYDDWTNLLQKLSLALVPLHPVLLWVERRMCLERELACDDRVMRPDAGAQGVCCLPDDGWLRSRCCGVGFRWRWERWGAVGGRVSCRGGCVGFCVRRRRV